MCKYTVFITKTVHESVYIFNFFVNFKSMVCLQYVLRRIVMVAVALFIRLFTVSLVCRAYRNHYIEIIMQGVAPQRAMSYSSLILLKMLSIFCSNIPHLLPDNQKSYCIVNSQLFYPILVSWQNILVNWTPINNTDICFVFFNEATMRQRVHDRDFV